MIDLFWPSAMAVYSALPCLCETWWASGKTIEVRRSEASDAKGKSDSPAQLRRLFYTSTEDRSRVQIGLPPMPKPVPPPAPPSEERTKEILADDRVQVLVKC